MKVRPSGLIVPAAVLLLPGLTAFYPKGLEKMLDATINHSSDNIKLLFYSSSYSSAHVFVSDLTGGSIIARSGNFAGKTIVNGVFDANDLTVASVSGSAFTHVIVYKDTGSDATSRLLAEFTVTLFTPSSSDVNVVWNASGIYAIGT